jgi:hypothetical protein
MLADPKKFFIGVALMAGFVVVLVAMFLPVFDGQNSLDYLDALFNSISKGSAYYIPELLAESESRVGTMVEVTLTLHDEAQAAETALLFDRAGASTLVEQTKLRVRGDLGRILAACLRDSDLIFANDGSAVREQYGYDGRRALYNWWTALREMDRDLNRQSRFPAAAFVLEVKKRGVECAYNYYGIEPRRIAEKIGVVVFSLLFYVVYTCWYGYAIIFMFEGWGLKLTH